ncbi:MAG: hypothetical protein ACYDH9_24135 [Limisphaerales bacterium]
MKHGTIISRGESLQILKNDLRKIALEKHAAELKSATGEQRQEIMKRIDRDIQNEVRLRAMKFEPNTLIH